MCQYSFNLAIMNSNPQSLCQLCAERTHKSDQGFSKLSAPHKQGYQSPYVAFDKRSDPCGIPDPDGWLPACGTRYAESMGLNSQPRSDKEGRRAEPPTPYEAPGASCEASPKQTRLCGLVLLLFGLCL